jgi:rhodanese-related sulfurtransferase
MTPINVISRDDLRAKLDRGDSFRLIMCLNEWMFRAKRIPGSIRFETIQEAAKVLGKDEDIVVYCTEDACISSQYAYRFLVDRGFTNVRRYSGGLVEWEESGYPLEGEEVGTV